MSTTLTAVAVFPLDADFAEDFENALRLKLDANKARRNSSGYCDYKIRRLEATFDVPDRASSTEAAEVLLTFTSSRILTEAEMAIGKTLIASELRDSADFDSTDQVEKSVRLLTSTSKFLGLSPDQAECLDSLITDYESGVVEYGIRPVRLDQTDAFNIAERHPELVWTRVETWLSERTFLNSINYSVMAALEPDFLDDGQHYKYFQTADKGHSDSTTSLVVEVSFPCLNCSPEQSDCIYCNGAQALVFSLDDKVGENRGFAVR